MQSRTICLLLLAMIALAALAPTAQAKLGKQDSAADEDAVGAFDLQQLAQAQQAKPAAVGVANAAVHPALRPPQQ